MRLPWYHLISLAENQPRTYPLTDRLYRFDQDFAVTGLPVPFYSRNILFHSDFFGKQSRRPSTILFCGGFQQVTSPSLPEHRWFTPPGVFYLIVAGLYHVYINKGYIMSNFLDER